ncbi:hypothetical protein BOTU111922_00485 [Bordetella tumulicola]
MHSGLTVSPWANTASPAANRLCAALMSRSWSVQQAEQVQRRTLNGSFGDTYPQAWQRLLEGYQRSTRTNLRPAQRALYSSCLTNSAHPASPMDLERQRFSRMLDTDKLSTAITWFSWINRVESWCRKSLRMSAILACRRASQRDRLLGRGIEPESVGTFGLHARKSIHTKPNHWIVIQTTAQIRPILQPYGGAPFLPGMDAEVSRSNG